MKKRQCEICGHMVSWRQNDEFGMHDHLVVKHFAKFYSEQVDPNYPRSNQCFRCKHCHGLQSTFDNDLNFFRHLSKEHNLLKELLNHYKHILQQSYVTLPYDFLKCEFCPEGFLTKSLIIEHTNMKHQSEVEATWQQCCECYKYFPESIPLQDCICHSHFSLFKEHKSNLVTGRKQQMKCNTPRPNTTIEII